jgi:hypothetical protein
MTNSVSILPKFFKDSTGKQTLWQTPNIPLALWIIFKVLANARLEQKYRTGFGNLSSAFLIIWSYLEIVSGDSQFRKALGLVILTFITTGYFK